MSFWPKSIISFFLILAAVNGWLLFTAINQRPGAIVDDPYGTAVRYQEVIDQEHELIGLSPRLSAECGENCTVNFTFTSPKMHSLAPLALGEFKRPNDRTQDFSIDLKLVDNSHYQVVRPRLAAGQWLVAIMFEMDGKPVRYSGRLIVD